MNSPLTIYRASAGSGKTFTLTAEYVALLLAYPTSHEAEHILAVTFTNKATAEMKDRILNSLYLLGHNLEGSRNILDKVTECLTQAGIHLEPTVLRQRAKAALSTILHDYGRFRVETIDSFFQSILHTMTRELGLASGLRIELNSKQVVARAVDRVMEHLSERPAVRQWVLDYVREQIESSDRWDIRGGMNSLGGCIYEEAYQSRAEQDKHSEEEIQTETKHFKHALKQLQTEHEERVRQEASHLLALINGQQVNFDRISYGRNTLEPFLLRTSLMGTNEARSIQYKLPANRITDAACDAEKLLKAADRKVPTLMEEARLTAEHLSHFCHTYSDALCTLNSIRLALHYLPPLRLLGSIEEEASEISAEQGQFLLSRTAMLLSRMVQGSDAPFILERAGVQFRHVMIDEFQDTSRMQWNNFRNLLLENAATGGHSLLVGDVKQSIYRWRGGDWEILQGAHDELRHLQAQQVSLSDNWRSLPEVVHFNNAFFPHAAQLLDDLAPEARFRLTDIYADVGQKCVHNKDLQGYTSVCLYKKQGNSKPDDYETHMVNEMAEHIRQLKAGELREQDIAILVRRNSTAARLLTLFHEQAPDIHLVSDEAFLLQASVSVQMLIAALHLIADGLTHADPVSLRFLMLHYQQDVLGCDIPLDQLMLDKPEDFLPKELCYEQEQLARLPLMLLVERLYQILQLNKITGQDAYMLAFMDEVQSYLRDNPQDIRQLLQTWDESLCTHAIPGSETGGIRILTIHKSKGLEYHTVLLPYMDWNMGIDPMHENLLWCSAEEEPFDQLGALPIRLSTMMENSVFAPYYHEETLQRRVDTLNMIYVAFTRARCNLMIWGITSAKGKLASVGDLICNTLQRAQKSDGTAQKSDDAARPSSPKMTELPEKVQDNDDAVRYSHGTLAMPKDKKEDKGKDKKEDKEKPEDRLSMPHNDQNAVDASMHTNPPKMTFMQSNQSRLFIRSLDDDTPDWQQTESYITTGNLMHYALSQIGTLQEASSVLDRLEAEGLANQSSAWGKARKCIERGLQHPTVAGWFAQGKRFVREGNIACPDPLTGVVKMHRPDRVVIESGLITVVDYKFGRKKADYITQVQDYMRLISAMYPDHEVQGWLWYVYSGQVERVYPQGKQ